MNMQDLHRMGKKAADQLGEGPGEDRLGVQREAVVAMLEASDRRAPLRRFALPALAGAALSVLVVGLLWGLWPRPTPRAAAPEPGMVLTARATPLVMELHGGNLARLSPDSVGQLALSTPREIRVVLVHGELTSTIRTPVRWSVQAGPYTIEAAGTEYVVRWKDERLEVRVHKGRVRVLGRDAPQAGWLVDAGEHLTIDRGRLLEKTGTPMIAPVTVGSLKPPPGVTEPSSTPDDPAPATADPDVPAAPLDRSAAPPVHDTPTMGPLRPAPAPGAVMEPPGGPSPEDATAPRPPGEAPPPPWKSHLQREEYAQAVVWIEKQGISGFADQASLADLQAMANAARYAGRGQSAVVLLVSLRTRFPGTAQASTAAFLMGRVYSEQLKDQRAAVAWFSTYLAEVPSGSLVEEALGRRMDAAQRAGMTAEAKKSAATLVERYPTSPFKPLALQILGTEK